MNDLIDKFGQKFWTKLGSSLGSSYSKYSSTPHITPAVRSFVRTFKYRPPVKPTSKSEYLALKEREQEFDTIPVQPMGPPTGKLFYMDFKN